MADFRYISEEYAKIGDRIIWEFDELSHLRDSTLKIAYLGSDDARKKNGVATLGQCEKVGDNFMVTIFEPNTVGFNEHQLEALIFHELLHIGVEDEEHDHPYIRPHDTEEFAAVIRRFGIDWAEVKEPLPFE